MENTGIPRSIAKKISDLYSYIDSGTKQSFIELFRTMGDGSVASSVTLPQKHDASITQLSTENKSPMDLLKDEVLDFYKTMDPEMYEVALSVLEGKNPNFEMVFFNPEDEKFSELAKIAPCITTPDDANLPYQAAQPNLVCVPINGYGTEAQNISVDDIFVLAHEFAHVMGYTFSSNKQYLGKIEPDPQAVDGVVFGESDSKVIEVQIGKFLLEKYPDADESVRDDIKHHLVKSFIKDSVMESRESFVKLGIGSVEYQTDEGYLSDDEISIVCSATGMSRSFIENQFAKMDDQGRFNGRDHLKYLVGDLVAVSMAPKSYVEVAQTMKVYWKEPKESLSVLDRLTLLGIDQPISEKLYSSYEAYAQSWRESEINKAPNEIKISVEDIKVMANTPGVPLEKANAQKEMKNAEIEKAPIIQEFE